MSWNRTWSEVPVSILKMINEAGHDLHADNPSVSAGYNLSILY
jgi:hypothetical protein